MGRRITRKQLKKNDEFVSTMDKLIRKFGEYWKQAAIGFGALMLVTLLWWVFGQWSASRQEKAAVKLNAAIESFQEERDQQASQEKIREGFEEIIASWGRTAQADVARLYLARMDLDAGKIDDARALLVRIKERHKGDAIGRLAALDLIHLQIASGQGSEVAKELEKMVVGRDKTLPRDTALYVLGTVYVEEQKPEQAREYFQKIVDDFSDSPYASKARQKLSELG